MIEQKKSGAVVRPEWSPEEAALSEMLRSGVETAPERTFPDPDAIFLLSLSMGEERPYQNPIVRVLLSWPMLATLSALPVVAWLIHRWGNRLPPPSSLLDPALLSDIARRLSDAGTPGWDAGVVLLCVLLYLTYEFLLETRRPV